MKTIYLLTEEDKILDEIIENGSFRKIVIVAKLLICEKTTRLMKRKSCPFRRIAVLINFFFAKYIQLPPHHLLVLVE